MIPLGLGIDLVEIERVARLIDQHGDRALGRLLTDTEASYCSRQAAPERHVAARVAAKEAAFKALAAGGDAAYIGWREFEVTRGIDGRPALQFHGRARELAERLQVAHTLVSLTHTDSHAAAVVALFR